MPVVMPPRVRGDDIESAWFRPCQSGALHLVSARFGPFWGRHQDAVVAQLVRAPVCGTGGRWFEPTQLYQYFQRHLAPALRFRLPGLASGGGRRTRGAARCRNAPDIELARPPQVGID